MQTGRSAAVNLLRGAIGGELGGARQHSDARTRARLHAAGFADPGRGPNYWKVYQIDQPDDVAIAREILTILYDVYGYNGQPALKVKTE